jgi:hypothetical protein
MRCIAVIVSSVIVGVLTGCAGSSTKFRALPPLAAISSKLAITEPIVDIAIVNFGYVVRAPFRPGPAESAVNKRRRRG